MEPQVKEVQNSMRDVVEKKSWITPDMQIFEVKEVTMGSPYYLSAPADTNFAYS